MKALTTQQVKDKLNYVIRVFGSDLSSAAITGAVNWDGYNSAIDKCSAVKKSYDAMAERIAELEAQVAVMESSQADMELCLKQSRRIAWESDKRIAELEAETVRLANNIIALQLQLSRIERAPAERDQAIARAKSAEERIAELEAACERALDYLTGARNEGGNIDALRAALGKAVR